MSYLKKLQKDKQNRINGIKYAPLVHDAKAAHHLALNNIRESKKLIERTNEIERERARWKNEAKKAEKVIIQTTRQIIASSGRLKRTVKAEELPNIVLSGPEVLRSKWNTTAKIRMDDMRLLPRIAENDPTRRKFYANVFLPSVFQRQSIRMKLHEDRNKLDNGEIYDKMHHLTANEINKGRRRSDCSHLLTKREPFELHQHRRASDGRIYGLKIAAGNDWAKKDWAKNESTKNEKATNGWVKCEWATHVGATKSRRNSLSLSLPSQELSHHARRPSVNIMDTVVEEVESEELIATAGRLFRSETI